MEFKFNRLLDLFKRKENRDTQVSYDVSDHDFLKMLGIELDDLDYSGKNALKEITVYTCISILMKAIGKLPLSVYKKDKDGYPQKVDHPLNSLLKLRPNSLMSAVDFKKACEVQRNLYGNVYINIQYDRKGEIQGLWLIDYNKVKAMMTKNGKKVYYIVNVGTDEEPKERKIRSDDMIHIKGFTTTGIVGESLVERLRKPIQNAGSSTEFMNTYIKHGVQAQGIIYYNGDLSKENERKLRERFEKMASGLTNANRTATLPLGFKYEQVTSTLRDAQFIENSNFTVRQLASAFGIKMHQLNDLDRATHTNISEQQREFYIDTLQEIITSYENEFTYKLLTKSERDAGYYIKFNADAILRMSIKDRYAVYKDGVQNGILTPNEARKMEEMPPLEGGNDLLLNGNMMKASQAGSAYNGKQIGKGGENDGQQEKEKTE